MIQAGPSWVLSQTAFVDWPVALRHQAVLANSLNNNISTPIFKPRQDSASWRDDELQTNNSMIEPWGPNLIICGRKAHAASTGRIKPQWTNILRNIGEKVCPRAYAQVKSFVLTTAPVCSCCYISAHSRVHIMKNTVLLEMQTTWLVPHQTLTGKRDLIMEKEL